MECTNCETGTEVVAFAVPEAHLECVPNGEPGVALCPRCLALLPAADPPAEPAFERTSDAFPTDSDAAIPMALLVGLLDNLALYRTEITTLLEAVERAGVDPLLVLDRLAADPAVETDVDLRGRRRHLEQLL